MAAASCVIQLLVILSAGYVTARTGPITRILSAGLLENYNVLERPTEGGNPVEVQLNIMLQGVYQITEGTLEALILTNALVSMTWKDARLAWVSSRYGVDSFPIPYEQIWTPDIRLLNGLDPDPDVDRKLKAVLHHDGTVTYMYPIILMVHCGSPRTHRANWQCPFTFGSWNYDSSQLDLQLVPNAPDGLDLSLFQSHTWSVTWSHAARKEVEYSSGQTFVEITYDAQILRR